jgi:hypothetical protein
MNQDRFWVMYRFDGRVAVLYRLSYPDRAFERWDNGVWVSSDQYFRISQDAACDEVDLETAVSLMKSRS